MTSQGMLIREFTCDNSDPQSMQQFQTKTISGVSGSQVHLDQCVCTKGALRVMQTGKVPLERPCNPRVMLHNAGSATLRSAILYTAPWDEVCLMQCYTEVY